ncbi:MAG: hypothetical protein IPH43_12220 [Xanthomonadales bacterium]|uniref:hypothetical protein n=1 Tax=Dokdonella sp. TaxID=2291710 RepID=UPI0031BE185B|nr:hypothetical protein [Xanthomonadales bacterium]MBK7013312.1 hypothetical protein [Xanthomonadales bacterium]MBK7211525.1 hypothetical protein [Xanthomonadales bacterium]MBL0221309.1 hypothetical protein [Xanthomonadales bacterium]
MAGLLIPKSMMRPSRDNAMAQVQRPRKRMLCPIVERVGIASVTAAASGKTGRECSNHTVEAGCLGDIQGSGTAEDGLKKGANLRVTKTKTPEEKSLQADSFE